MNKTELLAKVSDLAGFKALVEQNVRANPGFSKLGSDEQNAVLKGAEKAATFIHHNKDALAEILGDKGLEIVAGMISKGEIPDLSDPTKLLTDPKLSALRDEVLTRAQSGNQVEEALQKLKFDYPGAPFTPDDIARAKLGISILNKASDVNGQSNLDVLAKLAQSPKAYEAAMAAIKELTGGAKITDLRISPETAGQVKQAITDMDFDHPDIIAKLAPVIGADFSELKAGLDAMADVAGLKEKSVDIAVQFFTDGPINKVTRER